MELLLRVLAVVAICSTSYFKTGAAICADPGGVSNGNRVFSDDGLTISYTCHEGYTLSTGDVIYTRVQSPGTCWNGTTPYCNKIVCGDPGDVTNAVKEGDQFLYNNEITFRCITGFRLLDGSRVVTINCLATGEWNKQKSTIVCNKVSCPVVGGVSHGEPPQGTYYYGDVVTYPCQAGFTKITSATTLTCQETGYWDGSFPQCEAQSCPDPGEPPNSIRKSMTGLQYGDTVSYECLTGYEPFPHRYALEGGCQAAGTWSNKDLQCKGQLCTVIEGVHNSTHTPTTWRFPETVTFTCDPGFQARLEGNQNSEITCTLNGWDFAPPTCESVICSDNGEAEAVEITTTVYRYTQQKTYTCLGGFVLDTGELTRVCQADGTFSGIPPRCRRVGCADPGAFDHSNRTLAGLLFGDIISYTCFNGYIVGSRSGVLDQRAICNNNGTWNPPLEPCKAAVCGQPESQGLEVIGTSFQYADEVEFRCKPGYIAVGTDMKRRCQANGLWDGDPPVCKRRNCGDPGSVPFAEKLGNLYTFEEEVFYQCQPGYIITSGTPLLTCIANGTWNGTIPVCERGVRCPEPVKPANGLIKSGYDTLYLSNIEYLCSNGFMLNGSMQRTCEASGTWSGSAPVCERISCPDPGKINFTYRTGIEFVYGAKVNYSCVLGHTSEFMITYKIKTCNAKGQWDGEDLKCEPIECPNPGKTNATLQIMNGTQPFYYDDTVRYSCIDGYIILGQKKELYCQYTAKWSSVVPRCVPTPVIKSEVVVTEKAIEVVEAPDADTYGLVGITMMALEIGTLVLLDLLTISKDLKLLARNIRAGFRKVRPKVQPESTKGTGEPIPLTDADLDQFLEEAWAYRAETPSGMSYDDMSSSQSTLQDMNSSTADLVPKDPNRPSTAARRLQALQGYAAGQGTVKGEKKKKIIIAS